MPSRFVLATVTGFLAGLVVLEANGAPTAEQRSEIAAITTLLTKAGNLYKERKFQDAGQAVKEVQERLAKVGEKPDQATLNLISPIHKRLVNAHALLELEGISLPELQPLEKVVAKSAPPSKVNLKGKTAPKGAGLTVSFVKDVIPVLNSRCGGCHVRNARGMFSMASYEVLMKGPMSAGPVIKPGDAEMSLLIQKVADKEMPPSGAGIPDGELALLKRWVDEGARFDGPSPAAQLTSLLPAGAQVTANRAAGVPMATGKETVSFAREIAPLLIKSCTGCHGNQNPPNNLNLTSIASLFRGGDLGEPVLPGKPAESLLIKKLKGTADGPRMPQRAAPLDDATIAKFETWIAEGARFDAPNPNQVLVEVAAIAKAQHSTHEQLTADRAALAGDNWRLGMPGTAANKAESTNFLVLGNVGENTLADIAKRAEALAPKVGEIFKAPREAALVKGRVTLFVFGDRYDYGEFGKMVEKRDLPTAWRGHYRFSITDAYGAVLTPKTDDYSLDALIGQQLAAVYVASLGKNVPHWFAEGCGRVVASRLAPASDRRVGQWDDELSGVSGSLASPADFMAGKLQPEQADVCAFSFCKFLMADRRFGSLLDGLRNGGEFKQTFNANFGVEPEELTKLWIRNPPKVGRGRSAK